MKKLFHLTQQGVEGLQKELASLTALRPDIANRIKVAREFGDLSENMEYSAARDDQDRNESRIAEVEHILANVQIIAAPKGDSKVVLGSTVKLKSNSGKTKQFQIVGTVEADPLSGKISDESPIGTALMGKKTGDKITIKLPSESINYTIVEIA